MAPRPRRARSHPPYEAAASARRWGGDRRNGRPDLEAIAVPRSPSPPAVGYLQNSVTSGHLCALVAPESAIHRTLSLVRLQEQLRVTDLPEASRSLN
jgi:hypothetical protein